MGISERSLFLCMMFQKLPVCRTGFYWIESFAKGWSLSYRRPLCCLYHIIQLCLLLWFDKRKRRVFYYSNTCWNTALKHFPGRAGHKSPQVVSLKLLPLVSVVSTLGSWAPDVYFWKYLFATVDEIIPLAMGWSIWYHRCF